MVNGINKEIVVCQRPENYERRPPIGPVRNQVRSRYESGNCALAIIPKANVNEWPGYSFGESCYLISWVSGSQAERLVTDYFQIVPRYLHEMPVLHAGDMGFEMGKRAVIRLCQSVQPFAPVDAGQPAPPYCWPLRPQARHRGDTDMATRYKEAAPGGLAVHIIECRAGTAAQPQRQRPAAIIQPVHNLVYP